MGRISRHGIRYRQGDSREGRRQATREHTERESSLDSRPRDALKGDARLFVVVETSLSVGQAEKQLLPRMQCEGREVGRLNAEGSVA